MRSLYFIANFFVEQGYWNVVFLCLPASFSVSIGWSQVMNYAVHYIRLDEYAKLRAKKGDEITLDDLDRTTKIELIVSIFFTLLILAYPVGVLVELIIHGDTFGGNVVTAWEYYELFYLFNFLALAVILVPTTLLCLQHMRKVFGASSLKEETAIKSMLYLFTGTYTVRVGFAALFHYRKEWVEHLFVNDNKLFTLGLLCLWICWDIIPLASMFVLHYKNFNSFKDENENLYCEYSIDDARTTISQKLYDLGDTH